MLQKLLKQKTIVEQVMEEIKELIASGKYKVYDKIPPENELAEMFGVSRPTIREAVKVFNYLGVLKSMTGKGTFVSDRANISSEALTWSILLGSNELQELIETREVIELRGIQTLTENYKKNPDSVREILADLENQIENMKNAIAVASMKELTDADYAFHAAVIRGSGNSLFTAIYKTLKSFMYREIDITHQEVTDLSFIVTEHRAILESILNGNTLRAVKSFREHMNSMCFDIFNRRSQIKNEKNQELQ